MWITVSRNFDDGIAEDLPDLLVTVFWPDGSSVRWDVITGLAEDLRSDLVAGLGVGSVAELAGLVTVNTSAGMS